VTTFYSIDRATALLPEVRGILEHLQSRRAELIDLRDRLVASRREAEVPTSSPPAWGGPDGPAVDPDSPRLLEARLRAVVDQMEAGVARLVELDVQLRDIEQGLIDFPALSAGRPIWLCWQLGEAEEIHFWHDLGTGYASRRPLIELT
jgi:hypothetical protein